MTLNDHLTEVNDVNLVAYSLDNSDEENETINDITNNFRKRLGKNLEIHSSKKIKLSQSRVNDSNTIGVESNTNNREFSSDEDTKRINLERLIFVHHPLKQTSTVTTERSKGRELATLLYQQISDSLMGIKRSSSLNLKASPEVENRISQLRVRSKRLPRGVSHHILNDKAFRNPSIYEKLVEHMNIDEKGSNYDRKLYDPNRFGRESFYEELAKQQDDEERKRQELQIAKKLK